MTFALLLIGLRCRGRRARHGRLRAFFLAAGDFSYCSQQLEPMTKRRDTNFF